MEENNQIEDNNTIVEMDNGIISNTSENAIINNDEIVINKKPRKEFFWKKMSKKAKIITIISVVVIVLLIVAVCLYFLVFKKKDKKPVEEVENVVLEKDNYIYENGVLTFINEANEKIGTYKCKIKDVQECYIAKLTNEDNFNLPIYVDRKGELIERNSKIYNNKYVFVYDDHQVNLYNIPDKKVEKELKLIKIGDIEEDFIVSKDNEDQYGIISFENNMETIIGFNYEYLGIYDNDEVFVAKEGENYYLINTDEKRLTNYFTKEVKSFDDNYVALAEGNNYSLYDYAGNKVIDETFNYIEFNSSYVFVINDSKLYAYDSELNKLNNGIKIKSTNYQKKYIFDEKNNLLDTKKAYTITVNRDGTISIEESASKSTKTINIYEAVLSENYDYVTYLDGQLYFYKDLEKTELIGTYKCNNQNKITSTSSEFSNCFVAKESSIMYESTGYIPIFNDYYVFIFDAKTDSKNIVLYDLKANNQKARYQAIDTGLGNNGISFITSVNNLIYAQNTEGNYGVITFKEGTPAGVISFKEDGNGTTKITPLDDYLIATRGGINFLYNKAGDLLASSKFKIIEFKNDYLVVKDKGYLVYKMSTPASGNIISYEMDYVKLYDDFFVGIKNKEFNIYLYDKAKEGKLEDFIEIKTTDYAKAYKITTYSDSYVISIMQGDGASVDYKYNKDWSKINEEGD